MYLNNLGRWLGTRYERTGEMQDLEQASVYLSTAFHHLATNPLHRVRAATHYLNLPADLRNAAQSIELATAALKQRRRLDFR